MKMDEKKVFRPRISVLIVGLILVLFIYSSILVFEGKLFYEMYILVATFIFIAFIFTGIHYIVSEDKLHMKIWMIPMRTVEISQITSVKRSYNPLTSLAASLKRLQINFKESKYPFYLISPIREQKYIEDLLKIYPEIHVQLSDKKGLWRVQNWDI